MRGSFWQKSLNLLLKRQTNILSAAFVIMATVIFSQVLGLIRQRLLVAIFGASDTLGAYLASTRFPDLLFQIIVAGALSSAFIPVFSDFLEKNEPTAANKMASTLLTLGVVVFILVAIPLVLFAPFFLELTINPGSGFSHDQIVLMGNLLRIIIIGQILFIVGTFFSALLQSHNHFFIPGFAAALYNLGIVIGIVVLHPMAGIYSAAYGVVIGALLFVLFQLPVIKQVGFSFRPSISLHIPGVMEVIKLMWPRTIANAVFQISGVLIIALVSFLASSGRNLSILEYAQTLAFAPIALFGQAIAQAAFPVLSRQKDKPDDFKLTFMSSFNQILFLILPVSALLLVLRIPVVRLVFGVGQFDWEATVLTGRTLALFAVSIFAQALIPLVSRGFYALHDTKTPLIIGSLSTVLIVILGWLFIVQYHLGVGSIAAAYSIGSIMHLIISMIFLDKKVNGFKKSFLLVSSAKIFLATIFTGFALYIPLKLLDQLVFDTTKTINLIMLTGISSLAGLLLYLFLTWLFNVKEAATYILLFKKIGNWKEILGTSEEVIEHGRLNP